MIQIYPLLADFYVHLHCYMLKSINVALAYIFQIVVAHNQMYPAVHHCTLIIRLLTAHQTEMAEEHHKGNCHKWA